MGTKRAELEELLTVAAEAAWAAAQVLLTYHGRLLEVDTKTSTTDPVSEADRASEQTLVDVLTTRRPGDGLLGEEGTDHPTQTGLRWVIDPLDGTVNYLYGLPGWSVSVAVEDHQDTEWRAVAGAVLAPITGDLFLAGRGHGAHWRTAGRPAESPLKVNDPVALPQALIATGFSYDREHRRKQAAVAARVLEGCRDLRRMGSAALDLCNVAAGHVDGYYEDSVHRWDWAAAGLIAEEAGAIVEPLSGGLAGQEGVVAAGPALYPDLHALITTGR